MITIINAQLTDIPVIQEIAKRTWPITFQNILSESQIDYMLEMMYSPQALTEQMQEKIMYSFLPKKWKIPLAIFLINLNIHPETLKFIKFMYYRIPRVKVLVNYLLMKF